MALKDTIFGAVWSKPLQMLLGTRYSTQHGPFEDEYSKFVGNIQAPYPHSRIVEPPLCKNVPRGTIGI